MEILTLYHFITRIKTEDNNTSHSSIINCDGPWLKNNKIGQVNLTFYTFTFTKPKVKTIICVKRRKDYAVDLENDTALIHTRTFRLSAFITLRCVMNCGRKHVHRPQFITYWTRFGYNSKYTLGATKWHAGKQNVNPRTLGKTHTQPSAVNNNCKFKPRPKFLGQLEIGKTLG